MKDRSQLHTITKLTDRILEAQQHLFGSLAFGPLYLILTAFWVKDAVHLGWDNAGLTIYTCAVSVLAIYMSWVVTNILNRTSERDRLRDDLEAQEVAELLKIQYEQLTMLKQHEDQLEQHRDQMAKLNEILEKLQ